MTTVSGMSEEPSDQPKPANDQDSRKTTQSSSRGQPEYDYDHHILPENVFEIEWKDHTVAVTGDWTWRWLFLAPTYTLWIDGKPVQRGGGPAVRPSMEAILEGQDGEVYHLEATLTSIVGFEPSCQISIDESEVAAGDLRVANFLNPFLVLFILIATAVMFYVGPDVLAQYLP